MKVRLAVYIFSNSVADAMEYCLKDLMNKLFEGSEATIEFYRRVNNIFDVLNSRKFLTRIKSLSLSNNNDIKKFVDESIDYLKEIQSFEKLPKKGKRLVLQSERKTGFLCLITYLKTIGNLYMELLETKQLQNYFDL